MSKFTEEKMTADLDLSQAADLTVTPTSYLDTMFLYFYWNKKFKNDASTHVFVPTHEDNFDSNYFNQMYGNDVLSNDERALITDNIIPFHTQPIRHFAGLHVKYVSHADSEDRIPVISWLDSLGQPMPEKIRKAIDQIWTHKNKVVNEQVIQPGEQQDGIDDDYNCGVYLDMNFDEMIKGKGIKGNFATRSDAEMTAARKAMVTTHNSADGADKYTFVDAQKVENKSKKAKATKAKKVDAKAWSGAQFEDKIAKDLLEFGNSLEGSGTDTAFKDFDAAFKIAQDAYQNAKSSLAQNPHAFFNSYQGLQKQLQQQYAHNKKIDKTCAQEAREEILEEGVDFHRIPNATF